MSTNDIHNYLKSIRRNSSRLPDYMANSITDLTIYILKTENIKCLILDIDGTLVKRGGNKLDPAIIHHLRSLRNFGIELIIGSNTNRDITSLAASIDARAINKKWWNFKPMKQFYLKLIDCSNAPPSQIVMVGDKIVNDTIGANLAGLRTILVDPVGRSPSLFSRWYRAFVLRNHSK